MRTLTCMKVSVESKPLCTKFDILEERIMPPMVCTIA